MPTGKIWTPSRRELSRAWTVKKRGKQNGGTIPDICKALGISRSTYHKNRKTFEKFFKAKERGVGSGNKGGRPKGSTKIDISELNLDLLRKLILTGFTLEEVAKTLGVTSDTLRNYRKQFPEVDHIITNALREDTAEIMAALTHRAKGYSHPATHFTAYEGIVTATPYTKQYAPDTEAARLILANRIRFVRDAEPQSTNNKGKILNALEQLMNESEGE